MATTSSAHWGVFSAYDEVLEKVRKLAESGDPVATPAVQQAVFERAIWHYSTVFEATAPPIGASRRTGLVPEAERQRFFERMHADFLRYRPAGYRLPAGAQGREVPADRAGRLSALCAARAAQQNARRRPRPAARS